MKKIASGNSMNDNQKLLVQKKLDIENIKNICGELKAVTTILNTQLLISYMLKS